MTSTLLDSSSHLYLCHGAQINETKNVHLYEITRWCNIYLLLSYETKRIFKNNNEFNFKYTIIFTWDEDNYMKNLNCHRIQIF